MECKSVILISSSHALHFISLYLIFANSSTPSATQYLSPLIARFLSFLLLLLFSLSFISTSVGWAVSEEKKKGENRRRSMQRWAAIYPNRSQAPERLAHLAGSDSEEGMKIDSVGKDSQVIRRRRRLHCDFTSPVLRLGSGGVNAFERLWNVIAMYVRLREFTAKWTFTGCVYFKEVKVIETLLNSLRFTDKTSLTQNSSSL